MAKNILILILLFYFLTLLQTSFLVNLKLGAWFLSPVLLAVILINILNPSVELGIRASVAGGFFLDVFSSSFIGFWIIILLAISFMIHYVLKNYIELPLWRNI